MIVWYNFEPNNQAGTLTATVKIVPKSGAETFQQKFMIENLVESNDSLDLSTQSYENIKTFDHQNIEYAVSNNEELIKLLGRLSFMIVSANKTQAHLIILQVSRLMIGVINRLSDQSIPLVQPTPQGQKLGNNHYLVNGYIYNLNLIHLNKWNFYLWKKSN